MNNIPLYLLHPIIKERLIDKRHLELYSITTKQYKYLKSIFSNKVSITFVTKLDLIFNPLPDYKIILS